MAQTQNLLSTEFSDDSYKSRLRLRECFYLFHKLPSTLVVKPSEDHNTKSSLISPHTQTMDSSIIWGQ